MSATLTQINLCASLQGSTTYQNFKTWRAGLSVHKVSPVVNTVKIVISMKANYLLKISKKSLNQVALD